MERQVSDRRGTEPGASRRLFVTQRLRDRRRALGLTQMQVVARLAELGVHTSNKTLSGLEHGAGLDVARLPELATVLECTTTYLLGLTADPKRWEPDPPAGRSRPAAEPTTSAGDGHAPRILGPNIPAAPPRSRRSDRVS